MTIKIENLEYLTLTSLTEHTTVQEIKAHILLSIILHPWILITWLNGWTTTNETVTLIKI